MLKLIVCTSIIILKKLKISHVKAAKQSKSTQTLLYIMQAGSRNQENSHFNFRNGRMTDRKTNQIDKNKFKFE